MQLKMSKPFNKNQVKRLLLQENEFIANIFSKTPMPMSEHNRGEQKEIVSLNKKRSLDVKKDGKAKRAQTFEELYARLQSLKNSKRLGYKEKLLKKNLKTKMKKMSKRNGNLAKPKLEKVEDDSEMSQDTKKDNDIPKIPRPKPIFNSEGRMVFSKFDFSEIGTRKKHPKKDEKKILLELKQKKEHLKEMEQLGEIEKVQEIQEKQAWKAALAKSSGEKVKDDPDLLKRSLKKKEQKKKQSSKKWEARLQNVQKGLQERQEKRQDNIMKRKKEKKVNKLKKASKKGRIIPGF